MILSVYCNRETVWKIPLVMNMSMHPAELPVHLRLPLTSGSIGHWTYLMCCVCSLIITVMKAFIILSLLCSSTSARLMYVSHPSFGSISS